MYSVPGADESSDTEKDPNEYWAMKDSRECADEIITRCDNYWTFCKTSQWFNNWRRLYYCYNPNRYLAGQTIMAGESNEYRVIKVNHFRNLLEHIQNLSITDRPAWEPQSTNSDSTSQKQTLIARSLLDYYMREKRVERHLHDATRNALLFTEGFVSQWWETEDGKKLAMDPTTGQTRREGDLRYSSHEPVDVVRDPNLKHFSQRDWLVVRTYENKYTLAKKYPEYADELANAELGITNVNHYLAGQFEDRGLLTDLISVLNFYHAKTPACPEGRQMILLPDGTVIADSILLYEHIPVHRISPSNQVGTPMGMSVSIDLLPLQEMIDAHYSTILSINENYSIPKILLPVGSNLQPDSLSSGFQAITYNNQAGKPEVLTMPTAPDGLFKAMLQLQQDMETISGVNSVSRGNPQKSLESGSALALVQSMAIQFNAPLQASYVQLLEDVGTMTVQILQEYADTPRVVQISGKRNRGIVQQSFSKEDIMGISRVQVQSGNPMAKTVSGRLAIAQDLLSNGIVKTPEEYLMVLETGELEPLVQGPTAELLSLASENELLTDGQQVLTLFTDNHVLHIAEHTAVASDPAIRQDPMKFQVLSQHIMEHINYLSNPTYQYYRMLTNQPSLPPMQGMGGPQVPGQAPMEQLNQPAATQLNATNGSPMNANAVQQKAATVKSPQSPRNALTGERPDLAQGV